MADGLFYNDLRGPFLTSDVTSVVLSTTDKALYPATSFPVLGSNYWAFAGKRLSIRMFGRISTGTSPGNGTFDVYWGTGADANGTIIGSSAAKALQVSQTNLSWYAQFDIHCRTMGASGTLFCTGRADFNVAVVLSTAAPVLIPDSAPAATTVDTTANNVVSVQFKRSGSSNESMQVHDLLVMALN